MNRDERFYAFIVSKTNRSRSYVRRFSVHKRWVKFSALAAAVLFCAAAYGVYGLTQQAAHMRIEAENNRLRRENVLGKGSRSRIEDVLVIFRQRYLTEEAVTKALVTLVRGKFPAAALERSLYFHAARADQLLYDAVTEIIVPMQARGLVDINVQDPSRLRTGERSLPFFDVAHDLHAVPVVRLAIESRRYVARRSLQ